MKKKNEVPQPGKQFHKSEPMGNTCRLSEEITVVGQTASGGLLCIERKKGWKTRVYSPSEIKYRTLGAPGPAPDDPFDPREACEAWREELMLVVGQLDDIAEGLSALPQEATGPRDLARQALLNAQGALKMAIDSLEDVYWPEPAASESKPKPSKSTTPTGAGQQQP